MTWYRRLTAATVALQLAYAVAAGVTLDFLAAHGRLLARLDRDGRLPTDEAAAFDARFQTAAVVQLALGFACAIAYLVWVARSNRELRTQSVVGLVYSSLGSALWHFAPLFNFIVPYYVVCELWRAGRRTAADGWQRDQVPGWLGVWWVLCVVRGIIADSPWLVANGHYALTWLADPYMAGIPRGFMDGSRPRLIAALVLDVAMTLTGAAMVRGVARGVTQEPDVG